MVLCGCVNNGGKNVSGSAIVCVVVSRFKPCDGFFPVYCIIQFKMANIQGYYFEESVVGSSIQVEDFKKERDWALWDHFVSIAFSS